MFVFSCKKGIFDDYECAESSSILNLDHPEHYLLKAKEHKDFRLGKSRTKEYFKLLISLYCIISMF